MADSVGDGKPAENGRVLLSGEIIDGEHRLEARVYFADTDFSGAVYHARYLEFLERGRSDFLRLAGVHHTELKDGQDGEVMYWVVRHMEIDFLASAQIDDIVSVHTRIEELGGARIKMQQALHVGEQTLVTAVVTAAVINQVGKPRRFPKLWISRFRELGAAPS